MNKLSDVIALTGTGGTHKKRTPPREKKADVESGTLKKTVPMMMAWMIKTLFEAYTLVQ